jgi:hypothetical protein
VRSVIDEDVEVAGEVGGDGGEVALVGLRATVGAKERVPAGGRFPADEDDG